jgi:hypothetical protein
VQREAVPKAIEHLAILEDQENHSEFHYRTLEYVIDYMSFCEYIQLSCMKSRERWLELSFMLSPAEYAAAHLHDCYNQRSSKSLPRLARNFQEALEVDQFAGRGYVRSREPVIRKSVDVLSQVCNQGNNMQYRL